MNARGNRYRRFVWVTISTATFIVILMAISEREGWTLWWIVTVCAVSSTGLIAVQASRRRRPAQLAEAKLVTWKPLTGMRGLLAERVSSPETAPVVCSSSKQTTKPQSPWILVPNIATSLSAVIALTFTAQGNMDIQEQNTIAKQQTTIDLLNQTLDRYNTALSQLDESGSDAGTVAKRISGIYALKALAEDSPSEQPEIVRALSQFVRLNLPQTVVLPAGAGVDTRSCPPPPNYDEPYGAPQPKPDVEAALLVLGGRDREHDNGTIADLENVCLTSVDLRPVYLAGADLTGADLAGANFEFQDLNGALMSDTDLDGANFYFADLDGAQLVDSTGKGTEFQDATLRGADLSGANLIDADLQGTNLTHASLWVTKLDGARLGCADLNYADLQAVQHDQTTNVDHASNLGAHDAWWRQSPTNYFDCVQPET